MFVHVDTLAHESNHFLISLLTILLSIHAVQLQTPLTFSDLTKLNSVKYLRFH